MKSCAFFGHRKGEYSQEERILFEVLKRLIERYQVFQFYIGARGDFDWLATALLSELRKQYPFVRLTKVLSYIPKEKEQSQPQYFDDSIYLLERKVPPRFCILETNKMLVDKVDFVISGIKYCGGGARKAVEYAERKKKVIIDVCKGTEDNFIKELLS